MTCASHNRGRSWNCLLRMSLSDSRLSCISLVLVLPVLAGGRFVCLLGHVHGGRTVESSVVVGIRRSGISGDSRRFRYSVGVGGSHSLGVTGLNVSLVGVVLRRRFGGRLERRCTSRLGIGSCSRLVTGYFCSCCGIIGRSVASCRACLLIIRLRCVVGLGRTSVAVVVGRRWLTST